MEKEKEERKAVPLWLGHLLQRQFFKQCETHKELSKSELKMYCVECNVSFCSHCLSSPSVVHRGRHCHRFLQVRRYVYHDVIRLRDMKKFADCSKVQTFTVNGSKVIFLNPKKQAKTVIERGNGGHPCMLCRRPLPDPNHYCSLSCKMEDSREDNQHFNQTSPRMNRASSRGESLCNSSLEELISSSAAVSSSPVPQLGNGRNQISCIKNGAKRRKGLARRSPIF